MHSIANKLRALISLYRAAQRTRPSDFAAHAFQWLREYIRFDQGITLTSLRSETTWFDAHFWGVADPRALMESHARVRHLDKLSKRMLESVFRAHQINVDAPEISAPRFEPFREHLRRFGGIHVLGIVVPIDEGAVSSVLLLARGKADDRFTAQELELLEVVAPHFAEAAAINRRLWLRFDNGPPSADAFPVALLGPDGRFMQMTSRFAQLFWPEAPPVSAYLPEPIFAKLRKGGASQLPDGKHSLYGQADSSGGWLLRIRSSGPLDQLSPREWQIAGLFARGVSHKGIAEELANLAPATVRNHLRHIYAKLGVRSRDELGALLARP